VLWLDAALLLYWACRLSTVGYLLVVLALSSLALPSDLTQALGERWNKTRLRVFFLAVFTCAGLVHVHLPVSTFLTSPGEIGIHLENLLTNNTTDAMALVYGAMAIYAFAVVPRMRTVLSMVALVATVL